MRTPDSMAHRSDATCEQDSPSPAMQSQWAEIILPLASAISQGVRGFSLIRCE